jgi:hypothetical protein
MIEVHPRLFVGNQLDYETKLKTKDGDVKVGWAVVHAAKEPYHREAVGYAGRGLADRDHPEYLVARRGDRLCLNMIDAPKPEFFRDDMIEAAIRFIKEQIDGGKNVLVHCNQGGSRGPSLALLYLRRHSERFEALCFDDAEEVFRAIYASYLPAAGIRGYLEQHW